MAASREQVNQDLDTMLTQGTGVFIGDREASQAELDAHRRSFPRNNTELQNLIQKIYNRLSGTDEERMFKAQQIAEYEKKNAIRAGVWQGQ